MEEAASELGLLLPSLSNPRVGPRSTNAIAELARHEVGPLSARLSGSSFPVWAEARGSNVRDVEGNVYLDLTSSFGVAALGYCHPRIVEAIGEQAGRLTNCMAGIMPHDRYSSALTAIAESAGRTLCPQVVLTGGGSEAIEVALKLAVRATGRHGFIAFQGSFHGQALGVLPLTAHASLREPFGTLVVDDTVFLPYPDLSSGGADESAAVLRDACLDRVERQLALDLSRASLPAAIVVEPMQNLAGYVVPPTGFLTGLSRLCAEYGVLLVVDEVFTGFGRSGWWLFCDREDVVPDIVCVGKAMTGGFPMGACVVDAVVADRLESDTMIPLHGPTFMANPLACASVVASIGVLASEGLVPRAMAIGDLLLGALADLPRSFSQVRQVRGSGAAIGIEFGEPDESRRPCPGAAAAVAARLGAKGILVLRTGYPHGHVLALCPPLVISDEQLWFAIAALREAVADSCIQ